MAGLAAPVAGMGGAEHDRLDPALTGGRSPTKIPPGALKPALWRTLADIVTLKNLDGGGPGCHDIGPGFSQLRRWFHQLMAAGVLLAFAATLAAAMVQHFLRLEPPFALTSPPVLLGGTGGVAIALGAGGAVGDRGVFRARTLGPPRNPAQCQLPGGARTFGPQRPRAARRPRHPRDERAAPGPPQSGDRLLHRPAREQGHPRALPRGGAFALRPGARPRPARRRVRSVLRRKLVIYSRKNLWLKSQMEARCSARQLIGIY